ncbi:MAG: hypothetical protein DDT19_00253 [Syntrophomonadaceae bacterium]|nr:hypothetical protein [Bacillota bacterium]
MSLELVVPKPIPDVYPRFPRDGCVLDLDMQDTGAKLIDHSGFFNDGTNFGSTPVAGPNGWVRSFDGVDDFIQIPDSPSIRSWPNGITVGACVKSNTELWNADGMLVSKRYHFILHPFANSKTITFFIFDGLYRGVNAILSEDIRNWHHYVGTYSVNGFLCFYVDGKLRAGPAGPTGTIAIETGIMAIGWDRGMVGRHLNGFIGQVHIYNRALSAAEIEQIFREEGWKYGIAS